MFHLDSNYVSNQLGVRVDAGETAAFVRELTYVIQEAYKVEYAPRKARMLLPIDSRPSPAADSFVWRMFDRFGKATIVDNYAADFPTATIEGGELATKIKSFGVSYQYSIQDLRASALLGRPLDSDKAVAARESMEDLLESVAAIGDTNTSLGGFTNDSNISAYTVPTTGSGTAWFSSTGAQKKSTADILADVNAMQKKILTDTKGVHVPDTLLLPVGLYGCLATTARSPTYTNDSILQFILAQSPWLKGIEFWPQLDTAGGSSVPRVMMYKRDPRVVQLVIPQDFEQFPPQPIKMAFSVACHMRCGGVSVKVPKAVVYADGCEGNS